MNFKRKPLLVLIVHKNDRIAADKQNPFVNLPYEMRCMSIFYLIHWLCLHVKLVLHLKKLSFCYSYFSFFKEVNVIYEVTHRVYEVAFILSLIISKFYVHSRERFTRANINRYNHAQIIHEQLFPKYPLRKPHFYIGSDQ